MARNLLFPPSVKPGIPKLGGKPRGWTTTTFGDVLQVMARKADISDSQKYQLVTAKRNRGGIVPRNTLLGENILTKTQFFIKSGDFLISKRQIVHGACGVVPPELDGALVSNEYAVLCAKEDLLIEYLSYFSHTIYFQQTCFQSSVGVAVEKMIFDLKEWLKYPLHLPPFSEQERIVKILDTWDEAIAHTEQLISAKHKRKKALIQQLLTGQLRFQDFQGESVLRLAFADFAIQDKRKLDPSKEVIPLRCIELEHVAQETGVILGNTTTDQQKSIKNRFSAGQVLFGKLRPYLRKYAQPAFDGVCSSEIWVISGKGDLCSNDYLFYLVQSDQFIGVANVASGSKMPRADWDYVSESIFVLPSLEEQGRIVSVLRACDTEIGLLTQKLDALKQQKKGLMQQLLTGRIRVKV